MKKTLSADKKNLIKKIYLYFFMGVGLIMFCSGVFGVAQNLYKSALLAKYPLDGMESRCDYMEMAPYPAAEVVDANSKLMYEQSRVQAEKCRVSLEEERQVKKVTDLYNSIIILAIGAFLFGGHLAVDLRSK